MQEPIHVLDVKGLSCPMPLLKAKQALNTMQSGEVLQVLATDAGSVRDFASYSQLSGHELISSVEQDGVYIHTLRHQ